MEWPPAAGTPLVFSDGRRCWFLASEGSEHARVILDGREVTVRQAELREPPARRVAGKDELLRHLLAVKFQRALSDNLYSLSASRATFQVHQFKPAIKFFDSPAARLLIADEVGLGKTIEAGIIYQEMKARQSVPLQRVLVTCPSGLKEKWRDELQRRFGEDFEILNRSGFLAKLGQLRQGIQRPIRAIVPLESIRTEDIQLEITSLMNSHGLNFDLVIVDEAHHLRNPETLTHHAGEVLAECAEAMLLLTATPVQLGNHDLFHLLNLLDPALFPDLDTFEAAVRPNRLVNSLERHLRQREFDQADYAIAELKGEDSTGHFVESPFFRRVEDFLRNPRSDVESVIQAVRDAKELHTLSGIVTRTKKREVQQAAVRRASPVVVRLSEEEKRYYEGVSRYARSLTPTRSGGPSFASIMRERQAASCIPASVEYLAETRSAQSDREEVEGWLSDAADVEIQPRSVSLADLIRLGRACPDTKGTEFVKAVRAALEERPDRKILVFSFFKRTLSHLGRLLQEAEIPWYRIDGSVKPVDRAQIIQNFRDEHRPVMLSSEVGAEGLDFQFCDTIINYDLPWNPMRVEQRIGRLDRYGQTSESISIVSFILGETIEERILYRLYERIRIFEESIGDLEPILGDIVNELERDIFSRELSPLEQEQRAAALELALENKRRELQQFQTRFDEFLGTDDLIHQEIETRRQRGLTVAPADLVAAIGALARAHGSDLRPVRSKTDVWELARSVALADEMDRFASAKRLSWTDEHARFSTDLRHRDIWVLLDGNLANAHPQVAFIGAGHPLALRAIDEARREFEAAGGSLLYRIAVQPGLLETDTATMFVFRLTHRGVQDGASLFPVLIEAGAVASPERTWDVFGALQTADEGRRAIGDWAAVDAAQNLAMPTVLAHEHVLRRELTDRNDAVITARRTSINGTFNRQIAFRERLAREANSVPIHNMQAAAADNLRKRRDSRLHDLEGRRAVSVDVEHVLTIQVEPVQAQADPDQKRVEWWALHGEERPLSFVPIGRNAAAALPGGLPATIARIQWGTSASQVLYLEVATTGIGYRISTTGCGSATATYQSVPSLKQLFTLITDAFGGQKPNAVLNGRSVQVESVYYPSLEELFDDLELW